MNEVENPDRCRGCGVALELPLSRHTGLCYACREQDRLSQREGLTEAHWKGGAVHEPCDCPIVVPVPTEEP